jgi:ribonuclease HI
MICYVDGSCQGNGKAISFGGYGVVVLDDSEQFVDCYSHAEANTTNNRQELKAILYAFLNYGVKTADEAFCQIPIVYSDSRYCVETFNNWMFGWQKRGWLKSDKKPPENLDLIQAYYDWYQEGYRIDLRKVSGHSGVFWNEIADGLATRQLSVEEVRNEYGE